MYYKAFARSKKESRLPGGSYKWLIPSVVFAVFTGCACQHNKTNKPMTEQIKQLPGDSARLLTVANAEATANGTIVTAWFFETPQIFEFNLSQDEQAQQMFSLLKTAKEKGVPVNVYSTTAGGKNRITRITAATEAQLVQYKKDKAMREQPTPVPPPGNK